MACAPRPARAPRLLTGGRAIACAPQKAGDRVTKIERQQCEEGPCSEWDADLKPNCVLRCQSEQCYTTVYAADELEPGELDPVRANSFKACVRKEKTARLAAERDQKRARRGRTSR